MKWLLFLLLSQVCLAQVEPMKLVNLEIKAMTSTRWNESTIKAEIEKASIIWEQCNLKIGKVNVEYINPKRKERNLTDKGAEDLVKKYALKLPRPVIFLVDKIKGEGHTGYSYREQRDFGRLNFLKGTIFLPDITLTQDYLVLRDPRYSTLAHEMAHVLLNLGHTSVRNLLSHSQNTVNGTLTPTQCRRLGTSSYVENI